MSEIKIYCRRANCREKAVIKSINRSALFTPSGWGMSAYDFGDKKCFYMFCPKCFEELQQGEPLSLPEANFVSKEKRI